MRKKEIIEEIVKKNDKYCSLVWFARTDPKNFGIPGEASKEASYADAGVLDAFEGVIDKYPKDVSDLSSEGSDWHHGFNSGMLAGMRYVLSLYEDGVEMAEEEFPFLDT